MVPPVPAPRITSFFIALRAISQPGPGRRQAKPGPGPGIHIKYIGFIDSTQGVTREPLRSRAEPFPCRKNRPGERPPAAGA